MAGIRAFGVSDQLTAESVDGLRVIYRSLASSQWRFLSVKYGWNLIPSWNRQGEYRFTKLPAQRIEEVVRPNEQQRTAFENLKQASAQAADELKTSCPAQTAATPVARLDGCERSPAGSGASG
jgi:hypothetical protein